MNEYVQTTKDHFLATAAKVELPWDIVRHVTEVERWSKRLLKQNPQINEDVVLMSVWLHDIGQAIQSDEADHAVRSEAEARRFLPTIGVPTAEIERVAHCVCSHRNGDVKPDSDEARLIVTADSASHLSDIVYVEMLTRRPKKEVQEKLERDWRDIQLIPELIDEIKPLYEAWKRLIEVFPERD